MIEQGKLVFSGSIDEFNNYVAPSSLLVKLDITPPLEALKAIDGVLQVEEIKPRIIDCNLMHQKILANMLYNSAWQTTGNLQRFNLSVFLLMPYSHNYQEKKYNSKYEFDL